MRKRNLALAIQHTKKVAYQTLVRPQLEYAAPIWHPYNETEMKKVEKVQKTAARWVCRRWHNKISVDDILNDLDWPSLEDRRLKSSLRPRSHEDFFSGKVGLSRKISSCKLNSVAKFLCQISVTKLSELSSISNLCCL